MGTGGEGLGNRLWDLRPDMQPRGLELCSVPSPSSFWPHRATTGFEATLGPLRIPRGKDSGSVCSTRLKSGQS